MFDNFAPHLYILASIVAIDGQQVSLPTGRIQGHFLSSRDGRHFAAYEGIPYGQPPTGRLRFRPPLPAVAWEGVRNCTEEPNICPQYEYRPNGEVYQPMVRFFKKIVFE